MYSTSAFSVFAVLLVSMAFSMRLENSISIILLVVIVFLSDYRISFLKNAFTDPYFLCCLCFMLIHISGLLYTGDPDQNLRETSIKSSIIAIPFFFCANAMRISMNLPRLMVIFSSALFFATLYCLFQAFLAYREEHNISVFFYHTLLKPFNEHAVYYSFYVLFCIIYWMEDGIGLCTKKSQKFIIIAFLFYFLFIIILLASKIALAALSVYFIYFLISYAFKRKNIKIAFTFILGIATVLTIILTTHNPVKNRFLDLTSGTATLFTQQKFSPDIYFNGLQFRLLTWRFTYEILNEQKAWMLGVSAGDSQKHLHQKYLAANMYLGKDLTRQGYIIYNCHNIYLQTALESGLIGLASLLSVIVSFLFKLAKSKSRTALIFFLCMLAFGFTESYLSRQFGIVLFTFLPLLSLSETAPQHSQRLL